MLGKGHESQKNAQKCCSNSVNKSPLRHKMDYVFNLINLSF